MSDPAPAQCFPAPCTSRFVPVLARTPGWKDVTVLMVLVVLGLAAPAVLFVLIEGSPTEILFLPLLAPLLVWFLARTMGGKLVLNGGRLVWPGGAALRKDVRALRVTYTTCYRAVVAAVIWGSWWAIPLRPHEVDPARHIPLALWVDTGDRERRVGLLRFPAKKARLAIETLRREGWPVTLQIQDEQSAIQRGRKGKGSERR